MGSAYYVVLNVYVLPDGARPRMMDELNIHLNQIQTEYTHDEIILVGDFNAAHIRWTWTYNDTDMGFLNCSKSNLNVFERKLMQLVAKYCLFQVCDVPNSEGKFLDLLFTSNYTNVSQYPIDVVALFDRNSVHHNGALFLLNYEGDSTCERTTVHKIFDTNFRKAAKLLSLTIFDAITQDDLNEANSSGLGDFTRKINDFTSKLHDIQMKCTTGKIVNKVQSSPPHPWTVDKLYEKSLQQRRVDKEFFIITIN